MKKSRHKGVWIGPISAAGEGPLYRQIVDGFRREIAAGRLAAGVELPSFRVLAGDLMVSLITVKRAYEELERSGMIVRRQGLGTFVAEGAGDCGRREQERVAEARFEEAVKAAVEAGMGREAIDRMFRDVLRRESDHGKGGD